MSWHAINQRKKLDLKSKIVGLCLLISPSLLGAAVSSAPSVMQAAVQRWPAAARQTHLAAQPACAKWTHFSVTTGRPAHLSVAQSGRRGGDPLVGLQSTGRPSFELPQMPSPQFFQMKTLPLVHKLGSENEYP